MWGCVFSVYPFPLWWLGEYIYIYILYIWQKSSVFSHESAQRNVAGHLEDKKIFKTTRSFRYQWLTWKRATGGGHLENAFSRCSPPVARFTFENYEWFIRICLMSGNTKRLVAKWPCCFKDIFIYIYIYIYCVLLSSSNRKYEVLPIVKG